MNFSLPYKNKTLDLYIVEPELGKSPMILFLHGGSKTLGKERFQKWQDDLAKNGISSASFDFVGVGKSTGNFSDSSLADRVNQAICVAEWLHKKYPQNTLDLYGVSMGGYIALGVVSRIPFVQKVILQCPGAFSKIAHKLPFNEKFTSELRRENSWQSSLSFDWFRNYNGQTLIINHENDKVIPIGITKKYIEIGRRHSKSQSLTIKNAPHGIWGDTPDAEKYQSQTYEAILNFTRN